MRGQLKKEVIWSWGIHKLIRDVEEGQEEQVDPNISIHLFLVSVQAGSLPCWSSGTSVSPKSSFSDD